MKVSRHISSKLSLFLLLGAICLFTISCVEQNWIKTYRSNDRNPYGTYIIHKEIKELVDADSMINIRKSIYNFFDERYDYVTSTYKTSGNYIFISSYPVSINNKGAKELLDFVSHGNNVFIAANSFPDMLKDSLSFDSSTIINREDSLPATFELVNKKFKKRTFHFSKGLRDSHFIAVDPEKTTILGKQNIRNKDEVNYIKISHGDGNFFLHAQPIAFTNYHLLKDDHYVYAENVFSYLKEGSIYWDHNVPYSEYDEGDQEEESGSLLLPLSFMFEQPALAWAFWTTIVGLLLFMIFNAKRRQRIIAVEKPLKNATIDFTKTIGTLYYQEQNHHSIIQKKTTYFLEKVRNTYLLETDNLNTEFIEKLHQKSGKKIGEIKLLVNYIIKLNNSYESTEGDLVRLNQLIEKFFEK